MEQRGAFLGRDVVEKVLDRGIKPKALICPCKQAVVPGQSSSLEGWAAVEAAAFHTSALSLQ